MATTPQTQTPKFLAGQIMIPRSMLSGWLTVVTYLIPLTSGQLNEQFTDVQTQISNLLASTPNPNVVATKIIIPINMVNNLKFALATFDYQFHGINKNDYRDTVDEVGSVFDAYSIEFFTSRPGTTFIY